MKALKFFVLLLVGIFLLNFFGDIVKVEKAISEIGMVSMDSLEKIEKAEILFDALPDKKKEIVHSYYKLSSAREEYDGMAIRIQEGINVIARIGEVSKDSADAIARARQIYDQLEDAGLARYVTNGAVLIQAEQQYAGLFAE